MTKEEINKAASQAVENSEFYDYAYTEGKVVKTYTKEQVIEIFKKGVRFTLEDWLGSDTVKLAEKVWFDD